MAIQWIGGPARCSGMAGSARWWHASGKKFHHLGRTCRHPVAMPPAGWKAVDVKCQQCDTKSLSKPVEGESGEGGDLAEGGEREAGTGGGVGVDHGKEAPDGGHDGEHLQQRAQ